MYKKPEPAAPAKQQAKSQPKNVPQKSVEEKTSQHEDGSSSEYESTSVTIETTKGEKRDVESEIVQDRLGFVFEVYSCWLAYIALLLIVIISILLHV